MTPPTAPASGKAASAAAPFARCCPSSARRADRHHDRRLRSAVELDRISAPPPPGSPRSRRQGLMTTPTVASYLRWKRDVAEHDYTAASSYLSIRFGQDHADQVAAKLRKLPVTMRRANDILRATGREPLALNDPGVLNDLKKVLSGEKLSPILVAEGDIADGYHRVSLAYAIDPFADIPLKIG